MSFRLNMGNAITCLALRPEPCHPRDWTAFEGLEGWHMEARLWNSGTQPGQVGIFLTLEIMRCRVASPGHLPLPPRACVVSQELYLRLPTVVAPSLPVGCCIAALHPSPCCNLSPWCRLVGEQPSLRAAEGASALGSGISCVLFHSSDPLGTSLLV